MSSTITTQIIKFDLGDIKIGHNQDIKTIMCGLMARFKSL